VSEHPGYKILNRSRLRGRRQSRWLILVELILGLVLGFSIFDRVLMPLAVRHGADASVPDLRHHRVDEAQRAIEASRLRLGRIIEVPDAASLKGEIIAQEPTGGARVRRGRLVNMVVSEGPPVRLVPDLAGKTPRSASIELSQLDLRTGASLTVPSPSVSEGEIIGTRPARGESPGSSGTVDLLISGGAPQEVYLMPDLIGLDAEEAASRLRSAGIDVESGAGSAVRRQEPAPGAPIGSGDVARID
jgi:serine/threonine-protein kinase